MRTAGVDLAAGETTRIGIDCALGWLDAFVDFVSAHADADRPPGVDGGADWRRSLAYRATDVWIRQHTGRWPLSVSTDRLGVTALRCAGLTGRLAARGLEVDRSGMTGAVAEVYPGATLRAWGLDTRGYRVDAAARGMDRAALVHARGAHGVKGGPCGPQRWRAQEIRCKRASGRPHLRFLPEGAALGWAAVRLGRPSAALSRRRR